MYILVADEAGSTEKQHQSVATILLDTQTYTEASSILQESLPEKDFKFARVRQNDSYLQETKHVLDVFFQVLADAESYLMIVVGKSSTMMYSDMYEEVFLLSQSLCDDEIRFLPDQNNVLQRWTKGDSCKEYGVMDIQEQDSSKNTFIQVMDMIAGLSVFLREHYGTYEIWRHATDRYEQLETFERELHIRCELVHHFLEHIANLYGEVTLYENGMWSVEDERVVVMEM